MLPDSLVIGTRRSRLALWQAGYVRQLLQKACPGLTITLQCVTTRGDRIIDRPLSAIGGKGLFTEEIERGLYGHTLDLAVHSLKDMPSELPPGLILAAVPPRGNEKDAFVSRRYQSLSDLPRGAVVGTSSLRRKAQLLHLRPDLTVSDLRGNVDTRLSRLDAGDYDAIILAAAGLIRLGLSDRITSLLPPDQFLPAAGQGALAIEARSDDKPVLRLLQAIHDERTAAAVTAERACAAAIGGSCQIPAGAFASWQGGDLVLRAFIASPDGRTCLNRQATAPAADARKLGYELGKDMLAGGGEALLRSLRTTIKGDTL